MSQALSPDQQLATPSLHDSDAPRPARSKNGCNACSRNAIALGQNQVPSTYIQPPLSANSSLAGFDNFGLGGNAFFDFSGPLGMGTWDEAMLLSPNSWPSDTAIAGASASLDIVPQPIHQLPLGHQSIVADADRNPASIVSERPLHPDPNSTSPFSSESTNPASVDEGFLVNTFLQMLMPPILTPVEIGPKWASTRAFFGTMAKDSTIVRSAITAFAAMQIQRSGMVAGEHRTNWRPLYDAAARQLSNALQKCEKDSELRHILASLFLLTYTDLLTETLPRAHANLREAYNLIQNSQKRPFTTPEKRLISWIRLLDARAVSTAGGEGLFLADTDETLFDASPVANPASEAETLDTEIEEILFDVLYHPGIVFYQKVQSFVGRITRIDPWHRSRGTVQDETEVMALAAQISKDLHALYGQRPALMDHAVAGDLTEKHLARNLAVALTRSFRTYLANYYASFLHLHRVAYVQYPKTKDVSSAIANIKRLAHLMAETNEALPVNILWPLLMWGCEEDNPDERRWILDSIRGLETIATNAKSTADLLEEVQRRQDEGKRRVDVRSVSQEFFASHHFAIV
ncbi:hypothetical protein EJ04DRAFT_532789 [Polyplosphaeria fusca]|uniref:Uncharacterized protein n=1 Tax=Polyplosphaeria fusca TaxID=682080 RepID=A0A9P4V5V3_9PLEO|nr:hypothetical protein EJ04DRAFT_532789 [Polyplosphaeria fusca]